MTRINKGITESFWWLAGVIATHPQRQVVGRTRLQKTIALLQRLGLPTEYRYRLGQNGPYSEDLQSDVRLLEAMGMIAEEAANAESPVPYTLLMEPKGVLPDMGSLARPIRIISQAETATLVLAAAYDAFQQDEYGGNQALLRLRRHPDWTLERQEQALRLLSDLGLATPQPIVPVDEQHMAAINVSV